MKFKYSILLLCLFICSCQRKDHYTPAPQRTYEQPKRLTYEEKRIQKLREQFNDKLEKAKNGDVDAMVRVSFSYRKGKYIGYEIGETYLKKDLTKALQWSFKAHEAGKKNMAILIAGLYKEMRNDEKYLYWLEAATKENGFNAITLHDDIAKMYKEGKGTKINLQKQFTNLIKGANLGSRDCQFELGKLYIKGNGFVTKDFLKGYTWLYLSMGFRKDSRREYILSQFKTLDSELIGKVLVRKKLFKSCKIPQLERKVKDALNGNKIKNREHMIYMKVIEESITKANTGDAKEMHMLGYLYEANPEIEGYLEKSFTWYKKGAENNYLRSIDKLCMLYGNQKKYKEAYKMSKKGLKQNSKYCKFYLASLYLEGQHVSKDRKKAHKMLSELAHKHYTRAQHTLGLLYWYGRGVPKNGAEAYKWLLISSAKEDRFRSDVKDLEKTLTPLQIGKGQDLAATWVKENKQ